jgi:hypothetical protein
VLGIPSVESTLRETKAQFNSAHGRRHMNSPDFCSLFMLREWSKIFGNVPNMLEGEISNKLCF